MNNPTVRASLPWVALFSVLLGAASSITTVAEQLTREGEALVKLLVLLFFWLVAVVAVLRASRSVAIGAVFLATATYWIELTYDPFSDLSRAAQSGFFAVIALAVMAIYSVTRVTEPFSKNDVYVRTPLVVSAVWTALEVLIISTAHAQADLLGGGDDSWLGIFNLSVLRSVGIVVAVIVVFRHPRTTVAIAAISTIPVVVSQLLALVFFPSGGGLWIYSISIVSSSLGLLALGLGLVLAAVFKEASLQSDASPSAGSVVGDDSV